MLIYFGNFFVYIFYTFLLKKKRYLLNINSSAFTEIFFTFFCKWNILKNCTKFRRVRRETQRNEEIIQNTSNNRRSGIARSFVPRFFVSIPFFFYCSFSAPLDGARTRHVEINAAIARNKCLTNHTHPRSRFQRWQTRYSVFLPFHRKVTVEVKFWKRETKWTKTQDQILNFRKL